MADVQATYDLTTAHRDLAKHLDAAGDALNRIVAIMPDATGYTTSALNLAITRSIALRDEHFSRGEYSDAR